MRRGIFLLFRLVRASCVCFQLYSTTGSYRGADCRFGAPYSIGYSYQTNGTNTNLTGSPNYAPRVRINGDPGSGCSSDRYRQFNTEAFAGPTYNSTGMESGRNHLQGCAGHRVDLAIARRFRSVGAVRHSSGWTCSMPSTR